MLNIIGKIVATAITFVAVEVATSYTKDYLAKRKAKKEPESTNTEATI